MKNYNNITTTVTILIEFQNHSNCFIKFSNHVDLFSEFPNHGDLFSEFPNHGDLFSRRKNTVTNKNVVKKPAAGENFFGHF